MVRFAGCLYISFFLIAGFAFTGCKTHYNESIDTVAAPINIVVKEIDVSHQYYQSRIATKTEAFYEANNLTKNWLEKKHPNAKFKAFV